MLYIQLISFKDDDFSAVIAHSQEEACKLIEAGFEYVCDFGETNSSKNVNENRYKLLIRVPGIGTIDVAVDWGGFEPPTS